jgi:hypothetical protein
LTAKSFSANASWKRLLKFRGDAFAIVKRLSSAADAGTWLLDNAAEESRQYAWFIRTTLWALDCFQLKVE